MKCCCCQCIFIGIPDVASHRASCSEFVRSIIRRQFYQRQHTCHCCYTDDDRVYHYQQQHCHQFVPHDYDHLINCHVCHELIFGRALVCSNCTLICHVRCYSQIADAACCNGIDKRSRKNCKTKTKISTLNNGGGADGGTYQSGTASSSSQSGGTSRPNDFVTTPLNAGKMNSEIDVIYITERILVLTFPSSGSESAYKKSLKEVSHMLKTKHGNKYRIFNLSNRRTDLCQLNASVIDVGWPEELSPPLDRLCSICKSIETWMAEDEHSIVVVHSKGGSRSRAAIVIAAYMHYTNICASDDSALDRFAMRRFSDDYVGSLAQPSHRRYVHYFASLLSGTTKINTSPIYVQQLDIDGLPTSQTKLNTIIKIYERMQPVYTSSTIGAKNSHITLKFRQPLALRGDVLLKCFDKTGVLNHNRVLIFRCQFNTCALDLAPENNGAGGGIQRLRFGKNELDEACFDRSFADSGRLELQFTIDPRQLTVNNGDTGVIDSMNTNASVPRVDSYENFDTLNDDDDNNHQPAVAPTDIIIDSPLYASIVKPNESADSGIGTDSPIQPNKLNGSVIRSAPPAPPPKPRKTSITTLEDSPHRPPSVLPAGLRPVISSRPQSPNVYDPGRSTPRIDPDLVGKDRYDPASNAYAYVPARALNEHFTTPKKSTQFVQKLEDQQGREVIIAPSTTVDIRSVNIGQQQQQQPNRRPVTPKWEDDIDIVDEPSKNNTISRRPVALPLNNNNNNNVDDVFHKPINSSSVAPTQLPLPPTSSAHKYYSDVDDVEEKPVVIDQAKKITKPPTTPKQARKTRYGSYRTLNDDAYSSDMDDLCDPDFYLSYTSVGGTDTPPPASAKLPANGTARSVELPRRKHHHHHHPPNRDVDNIFDSTASEKDHRLGRPQQRVPPPVPPKSASSWSDAIDGRAGQNQHYHRTSRSVTSTPVQRHRYFGVDRYDSLTDAEDVDDWLESQLDKLRSRREVTDPDVQRRKRQEKLLLEELKHANDDRQARRPDCEISVEGVGTRMMDPLAEYRLEEERLRTLKSPYPTTITDTSDPRDPRRLVPNRHAPTTTVVRGKPPTPPPRERSRTPPSPRRMSPVVQQQRRHTSSGTPRHMVDNYYPKDELPSDDDGGSNQFDHLQSIVEENRHSAFQSSSIAANSPKSILKRRVPTPTGSLVDDERMTPKSRQIPDSPSLSNWQTSATPAPRSDTPAFPVKRETPVPYHPLLFDGTDTITSPHRHHHHQQSSSSYQHYTRPINYRSPSPGSMYYGQSRRSSLTSLEPMDVIHHHPIFVKDTSKYWYKPAITREDAINMLKDKAPGTFVVRDSNSFPGAFGLALKVASPPPGVQTKSADGSELVRHFLIEPSTKGVKLKGCNNEPVFGTLSALVYQHSITPLALPCKLLLPEYDPAITSEHHISAAQALLDQGAACNVTYIVSLDTESLTGPEAVRRCVTQAFDLLKQKQIIPVSVHFKVSAQGVTITDNTRKLFFRRHYPVNAVTFSGLDPIDRRWDHPAAVPDGTPIVRSARIFGFVARKMASRTDNACHLFAELEPEQPATAVVNFITKVMMGQVRQQPLQPQMNGK